MSSLSGVSLVLGGTRSGKSERAEELADAASGGGPVTYVATAAASDPASPDAAWSERIERHRRRRPAGWSTVESGTDLIGVLRRAEGVVLIDSLGTWVSAHRDFVVDTEGLLIALGERKAASIVVAEEVGMSLHAPTELGRAFVDAMGLLNREVASMAERVELVVAGRVLRLP